VTNELFRAPWEDPNVTDYRVWSTPEDRVRVFEERTGGRGDCLSTAICPKLPG
jgi:hypothetical protein